MPCYGHDLVETFAEVFTIDIAQLAVARKAGFAVSYYVPPSATHPRPYRESMQMCLWVCYGIPTHFQPKKISLLSRITALPTIYNIANVTAA